MYTNGEKAQLDLILGRKKLRNSFKNCQSYNSFDTIDSDHRNVSSKVYICSRQSKPSPKGPLSKIDWKVVLCDNDLQNRYPADAQEFLSEQVTKPSTADRYEALAKVAENILPQGGTQNKLQRKLIWYRQNQNFKQNNILKNQDNRCWEKNYGQKCNGGSFCKNLSFQENDNISEIRILH